MPDSRADFYPTHAYPTDAYPAADVAMSPATRRIDVSDVVARLRHLDGSAEPAMVFSQLSAVFVPAFCDEVSIDLVEDGGHRYRIRRPSSAIGSTIGTSIPTANGTATAPGNGGPRTLPELSAPAGSVPDPEVTGDRVTVEVRSPEGGVAGPPFAGVVSCAWREGYLPNAADGALVRLMVDHAVALIQRERLTSRVPDLAGTRPVGAAAGTGIDGGRDDTVQHGGEVATASMAGSTPPSGSSCRCTTWTSRRPSTCWSGSVTAPAGRSGRSPETIVDTGVVPDPGLPATAGQV